MTTTFSLHHDAVQCIRALLVLLAFLALVSWEDAAQDQHDRMHKDNGPACSMHIDWLLKD